MHRLYCRIENYSDDFISFYLYFFAYNDELHLVTVNFNGKLIKCGAILAFCLSYNPCIIDKLCNEKKNPRAIE